MVKYTHTFGDCKDNTIYSDIYILRRFKSMANSIDQNVARTISC